ncbi:Replicative DNA helicase (DnaB) [Acidisarcina polymorpha]|uniref:DNA 5'-3' helicase n=1 Tax=Acidisarcina polymorpha TaxID=2211140 RepID=A0A2Z5G2I7_9BACT|nr:DnaB-like helicase C-terminal domain-containing protein [Acidisarcina polymorpha]AXC12746.1 Replicative DNA helicase (DnaB) [Acidisarcina polymorpha]
MPEPLHLEYEERAILGHALNFEVKQPEFFEGATDDLFFTDGNRRILRAMVRLNGRGASIDLTAVQTELIQSDELSSAGGATYISDLTTGTVRTYDVRQHLETLRAMAAKRALAASLERALARVYGNETADDVIASIEHDVAEVQSGCGVEVLSLKDLIQPELDAIARERQTKKAVLGIPTGIASLDEVTTGWRSEFSLVGAYPGRGKTSFIVQAARAAAQAGFPVLILSLEMRKGELLRRLMSLESRLRPRKFREPREMNTSEFNHVVECAGALAELPIYVCDQDSLNPRQITATARLWIRKAGVKIVFVDFIQIVSETGRDARDVMNKVSAALRSLSKSAGIPVVAASQLSRANSRNLNERPTLFHLKETGNLEQDAHNVFLLHRPVDDRQDFTGADEIIIAKQRHGVTGPINVFYNSERLIFEERSTA